MNAGDESTIYNFEVKEEGGDVVRAELIEYASNQPFDEDFGNLLRFTGTVTAYNELKQSVAVGIFEEGINGECPQNNDPGNGGGSAGGSENYPSPKPVYPRNPGSPISTPGWPGNNTGSNTGGGDTGCWEIITAGSIDQFAEDPEKTVGYYNNCTNDYIYLVEHEDETAQKVSAHCNDGSGVILITPEGEVITDPCVISNSAVNRANNILKDNEVKTKMTDVLSPKVTAPNEWVVGVGQDANGYHVTPAVEGGINSGSVPASQIVGDRVADGHTHPSGFGDPSAGDFYKMLPLLPTNPAFNQRFVYGDNFGTTEIYVLIVNNRNLAASFLSLYPEIENYDPTKHTFLEGSKVGEKYFKIQRLFSKGTYVNEANEIYSADAVAMTYVLEHFNTGLVLAKADANGDLKKINTSLEEITVPLSGGVKKQGIKVTKCS